MSLETWKAEFYPIPASDLEKSDVSTLDLIDHSIQKWTGLLPHNTTAHGIVLRHDYLGGTLPINSSSCSLCQRFARIADSLSNCINCPLALSEGVPCDEERADEREPLYNTALKDPQLMVDALKLARDWYLNNQGEEVWPAPTES